MHFIRSCFLFLSVVSIFASEIDHSTSNLSAIDDESIIETRNAKLPPEQEKWNQSNSATFMELHQQKEQQPHLQHQPSQTEHQVRVNQELHSEPHQVKQGVMTTAAAAQSDNIDDGATVVFANEASANNAAVAVGSAPDDDLVVAVPPTPAPLQTDLFEFIDLIPVDEVNELKLRYYVSDPQVRKSYNYLQSYDYSFVCEKLSTLVEVQKAINFLSSKGLSINELWQAVYDRFGPPNTSITHTDGKILT